MKSTDESSNIVMTERTIMKPKDTYGAVETMNANAIFDEKPTPFRWVIYIMLSYQIFVQFFIMYTPTGLQEQYLSDYNLSYAEYALLFSMATGPTCIVPLFVGVVVDKLGVFFSAILSISILLFGDFLFAISMIFNSLILMYIARCIVGIGVCYFGVTNNAITYIWFHNAELSFSMGITPIHSRTGLAAGEFLSFAIYQSFYNRIHDSKEALIYVIWVTVALCAGSLIFQSFVLYNKTKYLKEHKMKVAKTSQRSIDQSIWSKIKEYDIDFCIVILIAGLGYLPFLGWMVTGTDALMTQYGYSQSFSNNLLLIPNLSALIGCFVVGSLIDKFGKIPMYFLISGIIYALFHLFCLFGDKSRVINDNMEIFVIIMIIIFGFGFSCFATTMWTSVAILSGHNKIGFGNGIAYFSYAIFYAVGQLIVGGLTDIDQNKHQQTNKYYWVFIFLLIISFIIMIAACILMFDDIKNKKKRLWKSHQFQAN